MLKQAHGDRRKLQQALDELLHVVGEKAGEKGEPLFEAIEKELHELCERIAEQVGADSAAVFLVTEDNAPGLRPFIVMRGASGRLKEVFDARVQAWRDWRSRKQPTSPVLEAGQHPNQDRDDLLVSRDNSKQPILSGFAYSSQVTEKLLSLDAERRQQAIRGWSVTNQIWHLAKGRLANSNLAMDALHGGPARSGRGDDKAYPGEDLHTTFRTMIGVPIFAQAGMPLPKGDDPIEQNAKAAFSVDTLWRRLLIQMEEEEQIEELASEHPASASSRAEFLSKYRVIGILKVEGKRSPADEVPDTDTQRMRLDEFFDREEIKQLEFSSKEKQEIEKWYQKVFADATSLAAALSSGASVFPPLFQQPERFVSGTKEGLILRKTIADVITTCCHAEFTRQDMELLVLLAMQVGRLMTHRVIKHAADKGIILSENEVGLLNVRWHDIDQLVALRNAADAARMKVEHHLKTLKTELDFDKRQQVYRAQISELLDPSGPIRDVTARTKDFGSLIRKLVRKQRQLEEDPYVCKVAFTRFAPQLEGFGYRSGERCLIRGSTQIAIRCPKTGMGEADVIMRLGTQDAPHATMDEKNILVALDHYQRAHDPQLSLVRRIMAPNVYHVDDLAGTRVITDYDSDIDEVLEELYARVREWGMELDKVDELREGKEGGYRAVHLTLHVDVKDLVPSTDAMTLQNALEPALDQVISIPVEIQLRTAYQHSWAQKTHEILYKREQKIAQELRDEQEILSNVLAEADWLSDIVRSSIENMLLPPDYGESRLLEFLKRRISPDDMIVVKFGLACAKEMLKDKLRYNGLPEFSFIMEVCESMVRRFGVVDSSMLLLALLYNVWRDEHRGASWPTPEQLQGSPAHSEKDIVSQLCERLEQICRPVLIRYRTRLPLSLEHQKQANWHQIWMMQFPTWFWAMQYSFRDYFKQPPENLATQWSDRLQDIYYQLERRHKEGHWRESLDEWLERAYMLEAAILLANLSDLPHEPGRARRKHLHNDYLSLFREIRRYLPNGASKTRVIEELDRAFREVETQLDLPREPEWWGE